MTKADLANDLGAFVSEHGTEEAGKVLSRMLLGLAHVAGASEIQFDDEMGSVKITPTVINAAKKH
tara:strand:+ start:891 stop:1085 length:195 start_codon:yes stop_codon:yes gene_type:complete